MRVWLPVMHSAMNLRSDVLIMIPARSGSVGVTNKNIRKVGEKSLLEWVLQRALQIAHSNNVIVSTDNQNYSALAQKNGVKVRRLRPNHLASDSALVIDVIEHELREFSVNNPSNFREIKYVLILEPSHFGSRSNINTAIRFLDTNNYYNSVFGVYQVPRTFNFQRQYWLNKGVATAVSKVSNYNRQELQNSFIRSGEFYLFRLSAYVGQQSLMPEPTHTFETERDSVNIDSLNDLRKARKVYHRQKAEA